MRKRMVQHKPVDGSVLSGLWSPTLISLTALVRYRIPPVSPGGCRRTGVGEIPSSPSEGLALPASSRSLPL